MDLETNRAGMPVETIGRPKARSKARAAKSPGARNGGRNRKRVRSAQAREVALDTHERKSMSSEQAARPTSVPANAGVAVVWVEAEQVFVARGYIYHMKAQGRGGRRRDSEAVIARAASGVCAVLSSHSPAQLTAMPPRGWKDIEPVCDAGEGQRLGNVLVAVKHGGNEYTVVSTMASSVCLAQGAR